MPAARLGQPAGAAGPVRPMASCMLTTKPHRCHLFWAARLFTNCWPGSQLTSLVTISHLQQREQVTIRGFERTLMSNPPTKLPSHDKHLRMCTH